MKKVISTLLVAVMLVGSMFILVSCGGLSGTYKAETIVGSTTLEFSGNKVTITNKVGGATFDPVTANYELGEKEDGSRTITFSYDEGVEEDETLKGTVSFSEGSDDNGSYIKIAGILTFYKQ